MRQYKEHGNVSLFDSEITLQKLSNLGNPLEKLSSVIDFEMFRERLDSKLLNENKKNNAGAKPYDVVMMFKGRFSILLENEFLEPTRIFLEVAYN